MFFRHRKNGRPRLLVRSHNLFAGARPKAKLASENNRVIEAFDLFVWNKWMDPVARAHQDAADVSGWRKLFLTKCRNCSRPTRNIVRLHQQDLMQHEPDTGAGGVTFHRCYEILAAGKKDRTGFFPLLIPGMSVVVQQDFIFHNPIAATSHLLMWRLRDHFEWLHQIPRSGSVVFLCKKRIDPDTLPSLEPESFSLEEIDRGL